MRQLWTGAQSLKTPCNLPDIWGLLQMHKEALPVPRPPRQVGEERTRSGQAACFSVGAHRKPTVNPPQSHHEPTAIPP